MVIPDPNRGAIELEHPFNAEIEISIPGLDIDDIGIEVLFGNKRNGDSYKIRQVEQFKPLKLERDIATFTCSFPLLYAGVHDYAFRVYPKHKLLSSRMDFPIAKWL